MQEADTRSVNPGVTTGIPAGSLWAALATRWQAISLVLGFGLLTIFVRLPSFFEPPWHTDEGIFQAVAQRVVTGGTLYADAWESKPPLFLYIYVAVIEVFGTGVLPMRIVSAVFAFGAALALFGVACHFMDRRRAMLAAAIALVLGGVPFWEGNLALTETFAVMPMTLAVLCVLKSTDQQSPGARYGLLALAGILFGATFLIRQPMAALAAGMVFWLFLNRKEWLLPGAVMALGSALVVVPVVLAFVFFGSFHWFWDANVDFFLSYVPSGQELPILYRPLVALPTVVAVGALLIYRRRGAVPHWGLAALWLSLTLSAALLTGRPYSHYFLPVFPPLALLVAMIAPSIRLSWRPRFADWPGFALAASVALLWFGGVMPEFGGNPLAMRYTRGLTYYENAGARLLGLRSEDAYNNFFDHRVNLTERLDARLASFGASGESVYIWGEYPWVYALADTEPATPYMTSFYTLLIPYLDMQLGRTLESADPRFIVDMTDAWPRVGDQTGVTPRRYRNASQRLHQLLARRYTLVATEGRARIFERTAERSAVAP